MSRKKVIVNVFYRPWVLILIIIGLLFTSCGKKGNGSGENEYFTFDSSKLGIEVADQDFGIKFSPPKGWNLRPTSISKKIESRGSNENPAENFIYQPVYVFFNDSTGGLLSVGKILSGDSTIAKSARINYYKDLLNKKYKDDNLTSANFINSRIYFNQIKFSKHNLVSYKIVFANPNNDVIQFDYTIPQNFMETTEEFIKASIGSIKLLNK